MTFREKLKQDHPELCGEHFGGGCQGCPRDYGYPELRRCSIEDTVSLQLKPIPYAVCAACWDQEMPEVKEEADCHVADAPRNDGEAAPHPSATPTPSPQGEGFGGGADMVNHPPHYTSGGIECIDAIAAALAVHKDPMGAWLTGHILKYCWRWPLKNGLEDLKKARFYLNRLIDAEEKKHEHE